jgi:hypothetical protein
MSTLGCSLASRIGLLQRRLFQIDALDLEHGLRVARRWVVDFGHKVFLFFQ